MNALLINIFFGLTLMTTTIQAADVSRKSAAADSVLTDFTASTDLGWYVLNDNVMGGRSRGDFSAQAGILTFAGQTNTDGGGFSSIRTSTLDLDLSASSGIRLEVKGDGRRYTWRLATKASYRGRPVGYWADFETVKGEWTRVHLPFDAFEPKVRGYQLDGPPLDTTQTTGMGLMIYDKQDGPFNVQLRSVSAYSNRPFRLSDFQWKKRVLVLSAPSAANRDLVQQLDNVAQTRAEFDDRHMMLVVAVNEGTIQDADHVLTGDDAHAFSQSLGVEPGAFALQLIGKDGSVKRSAQEALPMSKLYALIDTMPMRKREQ